MQSAPSSSGLFARLPDPAAAREIIERHHLEDRRRIGRARDKLARLNEIRDRKRDALERRATAPKDSSGAISAELRRLDKRLAAVQAESDQPTMSGARLEILLAAYSPGNKLTACVVTPEVRGDESEADALARVRREIVAKRAERHDVAQLTRTKAEVVTAVRDQIHAMALRGVPKVLPALSGAPVELPRVRLPAAVDHQFHHVSDGVALLCWLFEAELTAKIEELVDFNVEPSTALPEAEQRRRLAALDAEMLALRRNEAALVEFVVADGGTAFHFPDCPIEAVLSITA